MFFENSGIRFFEISWLDCEQYGKNQYKKNNTIESTISSIVNVLR